MKNSKRKEKIKRIIYLNFQTFLKVYLKEYHLYINIIIMKVILQFLFSICISNKYIA